MKFIPKLLILFFITGTTFAQQLSVSGKIFGTGLTTLSYVNVRVMNTNQGTAANVDGEYDLKLQAGSYFLIASYIGYYSDTIFVELNRNISGLDFLLRQTKLTLADVIIKPGDNPALDIIRKAIDKKKERNEQLNSYEFDA